MVSCTEKNVIIVYLKGVLALFSCPMFVNLIVCKKRAVPLFSV